jgi:hypothetical protein
MKSVAMELSKLSALCFPAAGDLLFATENNDNDDEYEPTIGEKSEHCR